MTEKGKFLQKINEAFAKSDTAFIVDNVTNDITWNVMGDQSISGKEDFEKALQQMEQDEPMELTIKNIITHGKSAAVDGVMTIPGGDKQYAFCDVYTFSGFKEPKIKEMTSYVVEVDLTV